MIIYLIRHGQSTSDIEDRYGGDYDDHLTEEGIEQAKNLATSLKDNNIEMLFYSPRIRTAEVADEVINTLGCESAIVNNFRECNRYGVITGMTKVEAKERYPDQVALLKDFRTQLVGGESYEDFRQRILSALDGVVNSGFKVVGILTHGGPIRCILREFFGKELQRDLGDCEVIELESDKGKLTLKSTI